jgi:uncharacterized phage protein gp47/JayE
MSTVTTAQIYANLVAQIEAALFQSLPILPKDPLRVLAKVTAGVYTLLYRFIGYNALQTFVSSASADPVTINGNTLTPLHEWGVLIGIGLPPSATAAELTATVTVAVAGGTLPAGTQVLYAPTGVTYLTLAAVALTALTVEVTLRASADSLGGNGAGVRGNVPPGNSLSFVNPLAGVSRTLVAGAATVTGADGEDPESYRGRVETRFKQRPQGGALADYQIWGTGVAGTVNVYPYRDALCPGQVVVYVEATAASSGSADGIPTTPQLQAVLDAIYLDVDGLASRAPVDALVNALPISRVTFDVTVAGLSVTDPVTVQAEITAAITDYLRARAPYIPGLSFPPRLDRVTQTGLAGVVDAIVSAHGGTFSSLTFAVMGATLVTYSLGAGVKAKLGALVFSA